MLTVRTSENTVITSFRLISERQDFSSVRTGENTVRARARIHTVDWNIKTSIFKISFQKDVKSITRENAEAVLDHERQEARELYRFLNV